MYLRIGSFKASRDCLEQIANLFEADVCKRFAFCEGFIGYDGYIEKEKSMFVGISKWQSMECLEKSSGVAKYALSHCKELGAIIVGEPLILKEKFVF